MLVSGVQQSDSECVCIYMYVYIYGTLVEKADALKTIFIVEEIIVLAFNDLL